MLTDEALRKVQGYTHAVLTFVDQTGYPVSVATGFRTDSQHNQLILDRPAGEAVCPRDGQAVGVAFSHIRPQPGIGYDQRRYVQIGGTARLGEDTLSVVPQWAHGWDENEVPFFELCERAVPRGLAYMERLSRRSGRAIKPQLDLGWLFLRATRLPFLTATLVPVLVGSAVAAHDGHFSWTLLGLTLVGAVAVHLGLNVGNDVFDHLSGSDPANVNPTPYSGGSRVIQYGLLSVRQMAMLSLGFYALGTAIGLYLALSRGFWPLLGLGVAGTALSLAYTAPPVRLAARGVGELAVGLGFGPIMVLGAYFVQAQRWSLEAAYVSLPVGILVALILYVNEIPDRQPDAATGKRTLVTRLPRPAVVRGYAAAVTLAYGLVLVGVLARLMPLPALLSLLTIPIALQVYRGIRDNYDYPYALMAPMWRNIQLHLAAGLLLFAGYVIAILAQRLVS
jgi:1,4-dihydroxy-2-naphthoate octaprenyltransferase